MNFKNMVIHRAYLKITNQRNDIFLLGAVFGPLLNDDLLFAEELRKTRFCPFRDTFIIFQCQNAVKLSKILNFAALIIN